jgi:hypothetical protein
VTYNFFLFEEKISDARDTSGQSASGASSLVKSASLQSGELFNSASIADSSKGDQNTLVKYALLFFCEKFIGAGLWIISNQKLSQK